MKFNNETLAIIGVVIIAVAGLIYGNKDIVNICAGGIIGYLGTKHILNE